ncbi:MAG TPA: alpha-2-macroglobulin [Stellaceae bacterium]|nr:alpha-2-macroglobulin [Stellaceae bacterium]
MSSRASRARNFLFLLASIATLGLAPIATPASAASNATPANTAPSSTAPAVTRLTVDTSGDTPQACIRFSQPLDSRPEAHYGDYLKITPALTPALRVDQNSLCLGGLDYATTYNVTLLKGMTMASGAKLAKDTPVEVALTDRPPRVAIAGEGFVLSRDTANGLVIQTVNVDQVRIHVLRMSDKLAPRQLAGTKLGTQQMNRYQIYSLLSDSASVVWSGTMDIASDHNRTVSTAFPSSSFMKPGRDGLYLVIAEDARHATPEALFNGGDRTELENDSSYWSPVPAHWVMSTDIGLSAYKGADGLHVFARSLAHADLKPKVDIRLIAAGQDVLGRLITDKNGQVVFPAGLLRGVRANAPTTLLAYGPGGDFAMLDISGPAFDLSDRGVSGRPMPGPFEAFLYADRGIFRPGETANVTTLLRDRAGNAAGNTALTFLLRRPNGTISNRFTQMAQPQGGFELPVHLSPSAVRGTWSVEAYVDPAGAPVGRVQFDVQDFVPQQLKVTLTPAPDQPYLQAGKPISAALDGQFLYGAPAAGLSAEANLRIIRDPNPVANAKGYSFGLVDDKVSDAEQKIELDDADDKGHVDISAPLKDVPKTTAPLKGVLSAGLFEPSGRLVEDEVTLPIRTLPLLIGIRQPRFSGDSYDTRSANFDVQAFDPSGKPVAVKGLQWTLIEEQHVYDWFESGSSWTWHYHVVDHPVASGSLDVTAAKPVTINRAIDWGYYRLVVTDPATQTASSIRFESGWPEGSQSADTPDKATISIAKPQLADGQSTDVRIQAPFAGKAEVVIANDRVLETRAINLPAGGTTIKVTASQDWGAGAYVVVSAYRPLDTGRPHDPVRAVGVGWIALDTKPHRLDLAIGTPDKVTPRQTVTVPIKVAEADGMPATGQVYMTLAAVDEGILQLTRFQTPDPLAYFFGKRGLGLDIHDIYGRLLDGTAAVGAVHQGGDEDVGGPGLPVQSTRTVSLFSGPVTIGVDGTANIKIDVPDFEGQLRLMAVAYDGSRLGHADKQLIVRDPVIADVGLPRFLAPGDTARLALSLHNTDGAAGKYHLALTVGGPLKLQDAGHPLDYDLTPGKRLADAVEVAASDAGIGTIAADLTGPNGYKVHRDWQIAIRAPHLPISLQQTALQQPGTPFRIDPSTATAFVPGSLTVSLGYAAYAGLDVPSLLQSLYLYPYGCTEQLSSTAFPLIYYSDPSLLGHVPLDGPLAAGDSKQGPAAVKARVQTAIDTILDRQSDDGSFGLWRAEDNEASPWLNVYAIDFLMHAKDAGFIVPDIALNRAYAWLQSAVSTIPGSSSDSGYYAQASGPTLAYAEYVLARTGRADIGLLRRLHDAITGQETTRGMVNGVVLANGKTIKSYNWGEGTGGDSAGELAEPLALGHLAGALALMGDHARAGHAFAMAEANLDVTDIPRWWFYYAYYTHRRDLAGLIAISAEAGDSAVNTALVARFKDEKWALDDLNTQDKAWLLLAAHALNKDAKSVRLIAGGKEMPNLALPVELSPDLSAIKAGYTVQNGSDRPLWATLTLTGAPSSAPPAIEQGYSIDKTYLTTDGKPLDPAHLKQNDRFIVSLSGEVKDDDDHRSVLVDMLPASWEIEAVIRDNDDYDFLGPMSKARVEEARDDRFVAAFDLGKQQDRDQSVDDDKDHLGSNQFHVAYLVRVVTPGHFALPEAVVSDMYRPTVMGRTKSAATVADPR